MLLVNTPTEIFVKKQSDYLDLFRSKTAGKNLQY